MKDRKKKMKYTTTGSVELLDVFGDELTIVNCARVSFGVEKRELDDSDRRLIRYLVRHEHYSPFRHVFFRFKICAPEFVMRQWYKHIVGAEWTSTHVTQLHGWNEISGRYHVIDDFYSPTEWRKQSTSSKQGSDGVLDDDRQKLCTDAYKRCMDTIGDTYSMLIAMGVAKEQARCLLPLTTMTQVIWTCSLQAVIHFIRLRQDAHAQSEIREFAHILNTMVKERFPISYEAFQKQQ
jgi:thymidylate synthase (FAD)